MVFTVKLNKYSLLYLIPVIIVVGSIYFAQAMSTTLVTPNLSSCANGYYLKGFDSNGSLICNPLSSNTGNGSYINYVLKTTPTLTPISTTSSSYINSGWTNLKFTKQYDDSEIIMTGMLDFYNSSPGSNNYVRVCIDSCSTSARIWAFGMPNNQIQTESLVATWLGSSFTVNGTTNINNTPSAVKSGPHTLSMQFLVIGGNGTFKTNVGTTYLLEVRH